MDILLLPVTEVDKERYRSMMQKYLNNRDPFINDSAFKGIAIASPLAPKVAVGKEIANVYLCLPELPDDITGTDSVALVNSVVANYAGAGPGNLSTRSAMNWTGVAIYMLASSAEQLKEIRTIKTVVDEGAPPMIHFSIYNQF